MDFIEQLLNSSGSTAILVIIDCLTKQDIFISTVDIIDALKLVRLFVLHVFLKHSVPFYVISNHGLEFMFHFFCSLEKALDITLLTLPLDTILKMMDRQECLNQMLEYFHVYCNY